VHRLAQLQSVAMLGSVEEQEALARAELDDEAQSIASGSMMRLQWETPLDGGDVRLRTLVPMLLADTATPASSASVGGSSTGSMSSFKAASWAMLATHLPGRSGRECRERCDLFLVTSYTTELIRLDRIPVRLPQREEHKFAQLDHRMGFVLALVDGRTTIEDIVDASGLSKLEALRLLADLARRRVIDLL
jgi:hypothetical protein